MTESVANAVARLAGVDGSLRGILVLELCGDEPSGTFGTQMLADLGATVIKIERPPQTDPAPTPEPRDGAVPADIAYMFGLNRNKRSLCIDLKDERGRALFAELVRASDVVYDNYKAGVTQRLGIDADSLRAIKPDIIACSVSGFGQTGPWSQFPAYDATVQALGGGMSITGTGKAGDPPVRWGNPIGGIAGAFYAVIGILAALRRRRVAGQGAALDIALLDAQLAMNAYRVPPAMAGAQYAASPHRGGNGAMPYGPFKASDGRWFVLGITRQFWVTAAKVLGHPEWIDDPRFSTEQDRQANEAALNAVVGEAMRKHDADEWQRRFVEAGIPGAKVATIAESFDHPHVAPRDMLVSFDHPVGRHLKVAGNPVKMSAHPYKGFRHAPGLGADTQAILSEIVGLDADRQAALREARIVWWPLDGEVFERPSVV
jgi:crotonobetainyl-CoA:carnitine CoA-transferase CaiB-like acyl-CoA transferase